VAEPVEMRKYKVSMQYITVDRNHLNRTFREARALRILTGDAITQFEIQGLHTTGKDEIADVACRK
jgi:hypothetical protein